MDTAWRDLKDTVLRDSQTQEHTGSGAPRAAEEME